MNQLSKHYWTYKLNNSNFTIEFNWFILLVVEASIEDC